MFKKFFYLVLFLVACTQRQATTSSEVSSVATSDSLVERGKTIYMSNCIACHNVDPSKDGSMGPAISGASLELIEARILHARYPSGYKPKRMTSQMVALPHLEKEIPALHAFLGQKQ